jgi:tetratricopeptide (TPR) repeat protein
VAGAVTAYQESVLERLRQTELARAAEEARAEEAKATTEQERKAREAAQARAVAEGRARRLTVGLAVSLLLLVTVGAVGGLWAQRQWAEHEAETARQRQAVVAALDKATELQQHARWAEARAILEQTRDRLGEAGAEDLRHRVEQAAADLTLVDRLQGIRLNRATVVGGEFDKRTAERDYAAAFHDAGLGLESDEPEAVAARVGASAVGEQLVAALDDWAAVTVDQKRREWLLGVARRADPDAWRDRFRDPAAWGDSAALERLATELLRDEAKLAKMKPQLLASLGKASLSLKARTVPFLTAAQGQHPDDFWLSFWLGVALDQAKRWDEAIGYYRAAKAIRPRSAAVYLNLGGAMSEKGQQDEAIKEYLAALDLDPKYAPAHYGLGFALRAKGRLDEAIGEYRAAIELKPDYFDAHYNLGDILSDKGKWDEAIKEFRAALAIDPKNAVPHLGIGNALRATGRHNEAVGEYRAAIALNPEFAEAHCNLGLLLRGKGQYVEALALLRRGHELGFKQPGWSYPSAEWVRQAERAVALEKKLPAILKGEAQPADDAERLGLAQMCYDRTWHASAARLWADAFAHDAKLADDLTTGHRYNAACAAALAGAGKTNDDPPPDDATRAKLRQQARDWLRADLAATAKLLDRKASEARTLAQERLQIWPSDIDLAGLRDKDAVATLPAPEREACQKLWADVFRLLKKAQVKSK